jgi:hypothetical protein
MKKFAEPAMAVDYEDAKPKREERPIGVLRVAKVTYDHHPIGKGVYDGSMLGQLIDEHIAKTLSEGNLVSEVTLIFETAEQQHQLADMYRQQ